MRPLSGDWTYQIERDPEILPLQRGKRPVNRFAEWGTPAGLS